MIEDTFFYVYVEPNKNFIFGTHSTQWSAHENCANMYKYIVCYNVNSSRSYLTSQIYDIYSK